MPRADVARLLGATGPGAWALAALFGTTYVVIAFWSDPEHTRTPLGFAALVLMVAAAIVLVLPHLSPFPRLAAAGVVGAQVFATTAGLWQLEPDGWRGWVTWYIGASSYLSFTLALRGRFWWGIGGQLALTAVAVHWMGVKTGDPVAGIDLVYAQLILFGAGAFFALWLRRTADRIAAFQETRLRRESAEGSRSAADEERARELLAIRASAGDALARIADGTVTDRERDEHLLLEAELRDRIRGRALAVTPLSDAAREARRRGAVVALLDDLRGETPPPADALRAAIDEAAERLAGSASGDLTVRLTRTAEGAVVTFATAEGGVETFSLRDR